MAWRFLRYKRPPTLPPALVLAPIQPAPQPQLTPLPVLVRRGGVAIDVHDLTTHGRYPCAQRDEPRVLAEVLGWTEVGPRPDQGRGRR